MRTVALFADLDASLYPQRDNFQNGTLFANLIPVCVYSTTIFRTAALFADFDTILCLQRDNFDNGALFADLEASLFLQRNDFDAGLHIVNHQSFASSLE